MLLNKTEYLRNYFQRNAERFEAHMFGDSSQAVFSAAVCRWVKLVIKGTDTIEFAFFWYNLELQAALLASGRQQEVQCAISVNFERCVMWTDCRLVLQWLHSIKQQADILANSVTEILEMPTIDENNQAARAFDAPDACTLVNCLPLLCSTAAG